MKQMEENSSTNNLMLVTVINMGIANFLLVNTYVNIMFNSCIHFVYYVNVPVHVALL